MSLVAGADSILHATFLTTDTIRGRENTPATDRSELVLGGTYRVLGGTYRVALVGTYRVSPPLVANRLHLDPLMA